MQLKIESNIWRSDSICTKNSFIKNERYLTKSIHCNTKSLLFPFLQ